MQKSNQLTILIVLLSLLLSFLGIVFVIIPQISTLKDLANKATAKQSELTAGRAEVAAIKEAAQLIKSAASDITLLGVAVPDGAKADEALVQVTQAATQAGLSVKSVSVSQAADGYVGFSVSTEGAYDQTITFIGNLEKSLRPAGIVDYNLSQTDKASTISATFNIKFPYITEATTATPTPESTQTSQGGTQ
jgi:Tfp pilus assembly protein PilO